jgi:hypothetical protein
MSEDENWERIDRFLAAVVPVATAAKLRIACHPHDLYTLPGWRGVTRVLGTVEGLRRFVLMHESPYHGLNFCQGTVAAMLDDPSRETFDVVRWFGEPGKLFNVHFRNIRGHRLNFVTGAEYVRQKIEKRLKFFQGEWFLDERLGFPWLQRILGKKPTPNQMDAFFRFAISTVPEVASVTHLGVEFDNAVRRYDIRYSVLTITDQVISGGVPFLIP